MNAVVATWANCSCFHQHLEKSFPPTEKAHNVASHHQAEKNPPGMSDQAIDDGRTIIRLQAAIWQVTSAERASSHLDNNDARGGYVHGRWYAYMGRVEYSPLVSTAGGRFGIRLPTPSNLRQVSCNLQATLQSNLTGRHTTHNSRHWRSKPSAPLSAGRFQTRVPCDTNGPYRNDSPA